MCDAVEYQYNNKRQFVYFINPYACLPVRKRSGDDILQTWGRRRDEPGSLPRGGWANHDSIHAGRWDRWFPRPVQIAAQRFLVRDIHGSTQWYPVTRGHWLQGLLATEGDEIRLYIVTLTPGMPDAIHERWPRLVSKTDKATQYIKLPMSELFNR